MIAARIRHSLLKSLVTLDNPFNTTEEVLAWIRQRNREVSVEVQPIPFCQVKSWHFDDVTGDLCHDSGKFFSICGLDVMTNVGTVARWTQPVINQPEVGYLGIIVKEIDGILYFLLQAKIEPGNVNCVQLSPTIQATRSNYTQVHGGKVPTYLDYFQHVKPEQVVIDQLQSEQGSRFLRKRNRNIIINIDEDLEIGPDFRWLTLGQIKSLIGRDNVVNMDTRTVISGLRFEAESNNDFLVSESLQEGVMTIDGILHRISELKSRYELVTNRIPLKEVREWRVTSDEIVREDRRYFRVKGVSVIISNREVAQWCQPIVEPMQTGILVLFCKKINGVLHFLVQAKVECGNFDVVELAPTIQCLTGNYRNPIGYVPEYLEQFMSGRCIKRIIVDTYQSEEGGRFYREQNRNVICEVNDMISDDPPENFLWLTLGQMKEFLRYNNYLNIQIRSLISALKYEEW